MESSFQIFPLTSKVWSPKTNYGCLPLPDSVNWLADKVARLAATIFTVPLDLISAPIRGIRHVYCPQTNHAPIFSSPFDQRLRPSGNGQPPNLSSPKATQQPPSVPVGHPPKSSTPSSSAPLKPSITAQSNPPLDLPPPSFPAPFVNSSAPIGQSTPAAVQPPAPLVTPPPLPIPSYYPMATPLYPSASSSSSASTSPAIPTSMAVFGPTQNQAVPPPFQAPAPAPFVNSSAPIAQSIPVAVQPSASLVAPLYSSYAPTPPPSQVTPAYTFSSSPIPSQYPIATPLYPSHASTPPPSQVTSAYPFSPPPSSSPYPMATLLYPSASSSASTSPAIPTSIAVLGSSQKQPVFYPLKEALSTLDETALLKLLVPHFNRREMNVWFGFSENHEIKPEDLGIIQQKITYADLPPELKCEARRAFYQSLRPLLTEGQSIELPFKNSFGDSIKIGLYKDEKTQQLYIELFFFRDRCIAAHKFLIKENGESTYLLWQPTCPGHGLGGSITGIIEIGNQGNKITAYQQPFPNYTKEWLEGDCEKHSNACFNLIMQSYERIRGALTQDSSEKNKRALHLFQNCVSLLSAFANKQHPLQALQNGKEPQQLAHKRQEGTTTTTYGPFWNPVTNASDSHFTWEIQEQKSGISFSSIKHSGGRPFHSRSERSVILSTTENPNQFKVTVGRSESWDIGTSNTSSEYLCELNASGHPVITGLDKKHSFEELALFVGMPDIDISESSRPTLSEQQADAQTVSEVLENIAELSSSPHTLLVPSARKEPCRTLQGTAVPPDRLVHFAGRCKNSDGGVFRDVYRKNEGR